MDFLRVAKLAALRGGEIILKYFNQEIEYEQKADKTFFSIADKESEEEIKKIILSTFPNHSMIGEESGKTNNSEYIWHVDPLDGTSNFKSKMPYCCVSIGLEHNSKFILGVIYNPFSKELFYAQDGEGAYLNDKKIKVNKESLKEGIIVIDSSFSGKRGEIKANIQKELLPISSRFRMTGSNALQLAELAKGVYVASISDSISSYDFIAGIVIAKEAGAIITDQFGNIPNTNSKVIIASNSKESQEKLLNLTKKHYVEY